MTPLLQTTLIVSALGYFVDMYDLLLFSIVRVQSLKDLGLTGEALMSEGLLLLNLQMAGLFVGGWFWGRMGDKHGRKTILLASILTYSLATLLNTWVSSLVAYRILRLVAGFGLAGELGTAITLSSELLPARLRSYGAALIAGVGFLGATSAGIVSELLPWRHCYFLGGALGLLLLVARVATKESPLLKNRASVKNWGSFKLLFSSGQRVRRYFACVGVAVPLWFTSGILITFAPEIASVLRINGPVSAGRAVLACYAASTLGDLAAGLTSQRLESRKLAIGIFLFGSLLGATLFMTAFGRTPEFLYGVSAWIGFTGGFWALFVLTTAEHFGSNLRATVTTSAPNMVRGAFLIMSALLTVLKPGIGLWNAAAVVGVLAFSTSFFSLFSLKETFGTDLDFLER